MMARFISTEVLWTEDMKERFRNELISSVRNELHNERFELSAHLNAGRTSTHELWVILQVFGGHRNVVIREEGASFGEVLQLCTQSVLSQLKQKTARHLKTREAL